MAKITSVRRWVRADRTNTQVGRAGKGRPRRTKVAGAREGWCMSTGESGK